eukprot:SAG11_NODE_22559_length_403_cov_8.585526_2_plen_50_part_01
MEENQETIETITEENEPQSETISAVIEDNNEEMEEKSLEKPKRPRSQKQK